MNQQNFLGRLEELIGIGEALLNTKTTLGPNVVADYVVNSAKFEKWRMSSMNLLSTIFGETNNYFKEFVEKCKTYWYAEAVAGLSILQAVRADHLADANSTGNKISDLNSLPLHPRIASVCSNLFADGHYSNTVYDASKALVNFVKERSGRHDIDGAPLMRAVFSRKSPVLAFNDLEGQSDSDEQEGMMHLYEGVALGIRNPRSHDFREDTPERAFEYICLISMLANRLEETNRTEN